MPCSQKIKKEFSYFNNWGYSKALQQQLGAVKQVSLKEQDLVCLAGEHCSVCTLGRRVNPSDFKNLSVPVVSTNRGGQLMHHGPGQLTLYFIFTLKDFFFGPREYLETLFQVLKAHFEKCHKIELQHRQNGLWKSGLKVGFVGLRIEKGCVYHGVSLNYFMDLERFQKWPSCDLNSQQAGNILESCQKIDLKKEACEIFYGFCRAIDKKKT